MSYEIQGLKRFSSCLNLHPSFGIFGKLELSLAFFDVAKINGLFSVEVLLVFCSIIMAFLPRVEKVSKGNSIKRQNAQWSMQRWG